MGERKRTKSKVSTPQVRKDRLVTNSLDGLLLTCWPSNFSFAYIARKLSSLFGRFSLVDLRQHCM